MNALYKLHQPLPPATKTRHSCIEPVLSGVINTDAALNTLACLGCNTSSSVYPVDLLVVAIDMDKLQPWNAAETVRSLTRILGRIHLLRDIDVDGPEVDLVRLQLKERNTLLGELVVAGQSALSQLRVRDGIPKSDLGDRCKHGRRTHTIAGRVEERSYGADGLGCIGCCSGCACVVLYTATDRDVLELEPGAYGWEACRF